MPKKTKPDYIKRATDLEIELIGEETIDDLKSLIQSEMESLGTWGGDHFEDKATEPAAEEEAPAEETGEAEDNDGTGESESDTDEEAAEEAEELSDEELETLMEKNAEAIEEATAKERKALCGALGISKGGKTADLADRLCAYEDHSAQQLAAAIEEADLWVNETSAEAQLAIDQRERRTKLEALKEEGIPAMMSSIRLFQSIGEYEDALVIAVNGEELWPKSTELRDIRKSIETQISDKAEAATEYEREQHSLKMEKKNKKRGRKAKVSTIQDCRDAANDLIIVTKSTMRALAAEGKANRRLHYAVVLLERMLKIQYR